MTNRSKKLVRQFTKKLDAEDAEEQLLELAESLKTQDTLAKFTALVGNFPDFFDAIDKSYEEYEAQIQLSTHNLALSSSELTAANSSLENLNASIAAMLDTLGQGLLFFGPDGLCSGVYSKAVLTLLEGEPSGRRIEEVLAIPMEDREEFDRLLKLLFVDTGLALSCEDVLDLFPKQFTHAKGLYVALSYKPMYDMLGQLKSVLVVATDRTEEQAAYNLVKEREATALMIFRMTRNRNSFVRFMQAITEFFSANQARVQGASMDSVKRDIHTFKGMAGQFQLTMLARALHEIETGLENCHTVAEVAPWLDDEHTGAVQLAIAGARAEAKGVLGEDFENQGKIRTVPLAILQAMAFELGKIPAAAEIYRKLVADLIAEPIHALLSDYVIGMQELADRYGRQIKPTLVNGENIPVVTDNYEALLASFVHIARNTVDHAIEDVEQRMEDGKEPEAQITITTDRFGHDGKEWMRLTFADDGRGINPEILRRKLEGRVPAGQLAAMPDNEILQYIFADNLSTKEEITELSGRGVGMSAVKAETEKLGGTAHVESTLGVGTKIVIEVPLLSCPGGKSEQHAA